MRIIAMYLPQFYRTAENDLWWGEGFTDWEAVKKARPLFKGHEQPIEPENGNYYNLLEKRTMLWQAGLMQRYGIDGMCFYHYWFDDGKRVLEKPAENLLKWKDIDMPYCFCWANETWARSWSHIGNLNSWAETFEPGQKECEKAILLRQRYGAKEQWEKHFNYLLPFFKDERYIKINNKPVFLFYSAWSVLCLCQMIDCWREMAKENGIDDLYLIGLYENSESRRGLDAILCHEPGKTISEIKAKNGAEDLLYNYDTIWETILSRPETRDTFYGGFVAYDDSPRRGKKGTIVQGFSLEKFEHNLCSLMEKNDRAGNDIIFINAWNEWGEGMILEPEKKYGVSVLETVRKAKCSFKRGMGNRNMQYADVALPSIPKAKTEKISAVAKDTLYLHILDQWFRSRERGISLESWFIQNHISKIAIYGYGIFAKHLIHELAESGVKVSYIIDKAKKGKHGGIAILDAIDDSKTVDAIIVTAFFYFEEIYASIRSRTRYQIISLQQIVEECSVG